MGKAAAGGGAGFAPATRPTSGPASVTERPPRTRLTRDRRLSVRRFSMTGRTRVKDRTGAPLLRRQQRSQCARLVASDAGSETPKSPNSGCDPQAHTDTDRCNKAWPVGRSAGCCGVPMALRGVPLRLPVEDDVNLPNRGAGVASMIEEPRSAYAVFSSSDKGELLTAIATALIEVVYQKARRTARSEGIIDDPLPFSAGRREVRRASSGKTRRAAALHLARESLVSLNPTREAPRRSHRRRVGVARRPPRLCAIEGRLHARASRRPPVLSPRPSTSPPRPGRREKTVRASGAAESIDKARCGGECGVSLPRLDDDERRTGRGRTRPTDRICASGPAA